MVNTWQCCKLQLKLHAPNFLFLLFCFWPDAQSKFKFDVGHVFLADDFQKNNPGRGGKRRNHHPFVTRSSSSTKLTKCGFETTHSGTTRIRYYAVTCENGFIGVLPDRGNSSTFVPCVLSENWNRPWLLVDVSPVYPQVTSACNELNAPCSYSIKTILRFNNSKCTIVKQYIVTSLLNIFSSRKFYTDCLRPKATNDRGDDAWRLEGAENIFDAVWW